MNDLRLITGGFFFKPRNFSEGVSFTTLSSWPQKDYGLTVQIKLIYLTATKSPILYSIVYVSTAQPDLEEIAIKRMLEDFRGHNDSRNIRGILLYSQGNFFQVLESEFQNKQVILDLFENIKKDGRHYDVIKILEKQTSAPSFRKYNTAFKSIYESANIKELYTFLKEEEKYNPEGYSKIAYLAQKFLALI